MSDPWRNTRPELWRRVNNNDINGVHAMAIGVLKDANVLLAALDAGFVESLTGDATAATVGLAMRAALPGHLRDS